METTEQENINNAVMKALAEFSQKLKYEPCPDYMKEKIDKIMGEFTPNHNYLRTPSENSNPQEMTSKLGVRDRKERLPHNHSPQRQEKEK